MAHAIEVEIERNYAVFMNMLEELMKNDAGKYALFHHQKLEGVYKNAIEAGKAGYDKFKSKPFSIQLVSKDPVDLGFYSYAARDR